MCVATLFFLKIIGQALQDGGKLCQN